MTTSIARERPAALTDARAPLASRASRWSGSSASTSVGVIVASSAFLAHLADEALFGMHDDPLIATAYAWLAPLGARHAAYLVFQITVAIGLGASLLVAAGGWGRRAVLVGFGLALLAEAHHPLRALLNGAGNAGLLTSLPLPILGALLLRRALSGRARSS